MVDSDIRPGDVCHDLLQSGKVYVVDVAAQTVAEHRETVDYDIAEYKANALLDVHDGEPVYQVVYLSGEPTTSVGKPYDMPRSRLTRIPVEEAEDFDRVQESIRLQFARELLEAASGEPVLDEPTDDGVGVLFEVFAAASSDAGEDAVEIWQAERFGGGESQ